MKNEEVQAPAGRTGRTRAATVSIVAMLVPAAGATASAWQAASLATSGEAATSWAEALLLLACLGSAGTLSWATAAVVVGVRDGWLAGPDSDNDIDTGTWPPRAGARRPGHVVAATVAAVVVAALTAGPASASAQPTAAGPVAGADAADEPEGTWGALADPGPPRLDPPDTGASTNPDSTTGTTATGATTAAPTTTATTAALAAALAAAEPFRAPRAVDPGTTALVTGTPSRATREREVVVHRGDSLWSLVEAHLGPGATDAEVALTWPTWWQANRATIGEDPHRLLPGQRLVLPVP